MIYNIDDDNNSVTCNALNSPVQHTDVFVDLRLLWILNTSFRFLIQLLCLLFYC